MDAQVREIGEVGGQAVHEIVMRGSPGGAAPLQLTVCTYGAAITSVLSCGEEITLGQNLQELVQSPGYFGVIAGRFANRIKHGSFKLDGENYSLAVNNGENHLHGGWAGLDKRVWSLDRSPEVLADGPDGPCAQLTLRLVSADGDEGYPGELQVAVTYTLTAKNVIIIDYCATTDKATPVNLTNHAYWNLSGDLRRSVASHRLHSSCKQYVPVDPDTLIPTGELAPVAGTPFDFTQTLESAGDDALLGPRLPRVGGGGGVFGFDHCFAVDGWEAGAALSAGIPALRHAVTLEDAARGRRLVLSTSLPGVQVYTGNFLPVDGLKFKQYNAVCLETEYYPDSPNQPSFPCCIVRPGDTYRHRSEYAIQMMPRP